MALTGKTRYRSGKSGGVFSKQVLILQVEYSYSRYYNLGYSVECEDALAWRDAKTEDLLELKFDRS